MPQICLYFQLHQPYRLGSFEVFDLGNKSTYFTGSNQDENKIIFQKVATKSYLPMLQILKKLLKQEAHFNFALSCSGVFLEQAQAYQPEVIKLLQDLVQTGRVEMLAETYYHSLAALYSESEFVAQVKQQRALLWQLFKVRPKVFRNTELIYSDHIGYLVGKMGYLGMLTEAVDRYLHHRPKTKIYVSHPFEVGGSEQVLPLLLKHAQLSDDIAFRFSDRQWSNYPLSAEKFLGWVAKYHNDEVLNLFMDFETFGEHQWADSGIFDFFQSFVHLFLQQKWNAFATPTHLFKQWQREQLKTTVASHAQKKKFGSKALTGLIYDVPVPISWADVDRDLTAWIANELQQDSLRLLYSLEPAVLRIKDQELLHTWRQLQTSDHFYYMCTKWAADGDVHAYFSPYGSPFEAYRRYAIVLADLKAKIAAKLAALSTEKTKPLRVAELHPHKE